VAGLSNMWDWIIVPSQAFFLPTTPRQERNNFKLVWLYYRSIETGCESINGYYMLKTVVVIHLTGI